MTIDDVGIFAGVTGKSTARLGLSWPRSAQAQPMLEDGRLCPDVAAVYALQDVAHAGKDVAGHLTVDTPGTALFAVPMCERR